MTIALLCPSKGRPEKCARMVQSAVATTTLPVQIYIAMCEEEFQSYKDAIKIPEDRHAKIAFIVMPDCPTGYRWNFLSEVAMRDTGNKLFMLSSDDMVFSTPCWDTALIEAYKGKPHVYHLRDSRDENGTPHPIVSREYIEAMGYFLPPLFLHWFVDSWTVEIAKANDCFTHIKDFMLLHDKPSDRGEADKTHTDIRQNGWHLRDGYVDEKCRHWLEIEKERLAWHLSGVRKA